MSDKCAEYLRKLEHLEPIVLAELDRLGNPKGAELREAVERLVSSDVDYLIRSAILRLWDRKVITMRPDRTYARNTSAE